MIVDLYSGPRGWSEGLRMLGLSDVGVELDAAACATAAAAGHRTIRADVAAYPPERFVGADGVIISPPCQAFSTAGNGEGRAVLNALCHAVARGSWWEFDRAAGYGHVLEVGRWAETIRPTWIACEQVPPVLPVWQSYVDRWRGLGWSAWAGILNAADYGVPQTRQRAFLLARTDGRPVSPPEPTHCRGGAITMFGELDPWVPMADALGWGVTKRYERNVDRPSPTVASNARTWAWDRPATTVCGDPRLSFPGHHDEDHRGLSADEGSIKLTIAEALTLQSFRPDYPVQGTKTKQFEQIGNAVPPLLAAQVIAAVTGRVLEERAA